MAAETLGTDGMGRISPMQRIAAWAVHLYTASGLVLALLAIAAVFRKDWHSVLVLMVAAFVIDGTDGALARAVRVKDVLPQVDGRLLDSLTDIVNHAFVPAVLLAYGDMLPPHMAVPAAAASLLASAYHWSNTRSVSADRYLVGFPGNWNLVAGYLLVLRFPPLAALAVVVLFVVLSFVPLKWVYVSQAREHRAIVRMAAVLWAAAWAIILLGYPPPRWQVVISLIPAVLLVALGIRSTFRRDPDQARM